MKKTFSQDEYLKTYSKELDKFNTNQVHFNAIKYLKIKKGDKILDIGCGEGELIKLIVESGGNGFGIDYMKKSIETANRNVKNASFKIGSATKLPYNDKQFNKIVMLGTIGYLSEKDLEKCFSECNRVLLANGVFLIRTSQPLNSIGNIFLKLFVKNHDSKTNNYPFSTYKKYLLENNFEITITWLSLDRENKKGIKNIMVNILFPFFAARWMIAKKVQ